MAQTRHTRKTRRARKTRRTRGGMENNASDSICEHLRVLFPEFDISHFKITDAGEYYQINIIKCEEQARHPKKYSPRISISKDGNMYIEGLTSCKPISGAEIIRRYIHLARQLGLHSIHVDDGSEIYFPRSRYGDERCVIDLPILRILQKGESWYESLGFVASTSEAKRAKNEQVRQMPFGTFVKKLLKKERREAMERIIRQNREKENAEEKRSELEGLMDTFPEIDEATPVYRAIQQMIDRVNKTENACESESFRMLQKVIDICTLGDDNPIINYNMDNLTMTL